VPVGAYLVMLLLRPIGCTNRCRMPLLSFGLKLMNSRSDSSLKYLPEYHVKSAGIMRSGSVLNLRGQSCGVHAVSSRVADVIRDLELKETMAMMRRHRKRQPKCEAHSKRPTTEYTPLSALAHHTLRVLRRLMHVVPAPAQRRAAPRNVKQLLHTRHAPTSNRHATLAVCSAHFRLLCWCKKTILSPRVRTLVVTRPPRTRSVFCTERSRPDAYAALILWYLFKCHKNTTDEGAVAASHCMTIVSGMSMPPCPVEAARIS
jgi:hypothetical protein